MDFMDDLQLFSFNHKFKSFSSKLLVHFNKSSMSVVGLSSSLGSSCSVQSKRQYKLDNNNYIKPKL